MKVSPTAPARITPILSGKAPRIQGFGTVSVRPGLQFRLHIVREDLSFQIQQIFGVVGKSHCRQGLSDLQEMFPVYGLEKYIGPLCLSF